MLSALKNWQGSVKVNDVLYDSIRDAESVLERLDGEIHITLYPKKKTTVQSVTDSAETKITVKAYMTRKATPEFDFMAKWNKDIPMPLRTMVGIVIKETKGMVYMKLHGDIYAEKICTCMKCGRALTNPVSQYFGIGPECGGHNYVNPFDDDEQLKEAVAEYKKQLQSVTWEGWVIKSAIVEKEEI